MHVCRQGNADLAIHYYDDCVETRKYVTKKTPAVYHCITDYLATEI